MYEKRLNVIANVATSGSNSTEINISIIRHIGVWGAADEPVLNNVKLEKKVKKKKKNRAKKMINTVLQH